MIVDDRFNFLSLSLTILFGFKRFMIVDEIANCKQIWRAPKSAISVTFEISVRKLRFEDIEAYQRMMRMNQQGILQNFDAHFLSLYHLPFRFEPAVLAKLLTEKLSPEPSSARSNGKNYHQLLCRIWTWATRTHVIVRVIINYEDLLNGALALN